MPAVHWRFWTAPACIGANRALRGVARQHGGGGDCVGAGGCRQPVAALVLEAPLSSVSDVAAHHYPWVPVRWLLKDRFEAVARIAHVGAPVLIIHGEADEIVPIRYGRALSEAAREPKEAVWIPGGGHEDLADFGLGASVVTTAREVVMWWPRPARMPAALLAAARRARRLRSPRA